MFSFAQKHAFKTFLSSPVRLARLNAKTHLGRTPCKTAAMPAWNTRSKKKKT